MGARAMGNLLFWLGIGAAQKGAGSKPIVRRHWVVSFVVGILAITNAIVVHGRGCLSTCVEVCQQRHKNKRGSYHDVAPCSLLRTTALTAMP